MEGNFELNDYLTLTSGIRTDFVTSRLDDPAADFETLYGPINTAKETNFSLHSNLKYKRNRTQLQFAIGRGTRTASMVERYINHFTIGSDPYEYVGNPFLNPEVNTQIEFSIVQNFDGFEIGGSVFYSFLSDYIMAEINTDIPRKYMPTTPPVVSRQFGNLESASQQGFEFDFKTSISDRFSFLTNMSYTRGEDRDNDQPLAQIPPFKLTMELKYSNDLLWATLSSRIVARQNRVSELFMEKESPGYGTTDIRLGFEPLKNLTMGFAVLNIFDKAYYDHLNFTYKNSNLNAERILETGRNFTTYIKYTL
jgi:iron complex outermembrane receptor protein